jgi:hypothetical protein
VVDPGAVSRPSRGRKGVYGLITLKWVGTKQHDFFAGVRIAPKHVAFHLMPVYADPKLLDGMSAGLRKHLTGRTTFTFAAIEPDLFAELDGLTARCFEAYEAGGR